MHIKPHFSFTFLVVLISLSGALYGEGEGVENLVVEPMFEEKISNLQTILNQFQN